MATAVSIYIKRDEKILGPFSEEQTVKRYDRGEFTDGDLAMIDGVTGWHPLASYIVEESATGPAIFDASGPPPLPRREERPARIEATSEPRPEPILGVGGRRLALVNPLATAWALLGMGVVVMFFSRWPWTLWIPPILAAIGLAVQQLVRRNYIHGAPLLAVALLLPWFVWSQWLKPVRPAVGLTSAELAAHEKALPATPAPHAATPTPEPPKIVAEPAPAPPAVAPPPEPAAPSRPIAKGDRVVLERDAQLFFNTKPFRVGKAGEEFEVLVTQPDKLFLKTRDVAGRVIAVSVGLNEVRLRPPPVDAEFSRPFVN